MSKNPRWYNRIRVFNRQYEYFMNLCENYTGVFSDFEESKKFFTFLKICFEFYHKSLRDILNEKCISLFLPTDIFVCAQKINLIDDAEVWLNYIDDLNWYYQTYGDYKQMAITKMIIDKYKDKLINAYKNLNKFYDSAPYDDNCVIKPFCAEEKPKYLPQEIGISEVSYNIILDYFKSNKNIRNVWLHGSRAKGNAKSHSDIDFLMDIDMEYVPDCKTDIDKLAVPYRVDFVSIKDDTATVFLNYVVSDAKIIYRSIDYSETNF